MHCKRGKVRTFDDDGHVAHGEGAVGRGRDVALEVGDADLPLRGQADCPPLLRRVMREASHLARRAVGHLGIDTRRAHDGDRLAAVGLEEVHCRIAVDEELADGLRVGELALEDGERDGDRTRRMAVDEIGPVARVHRAAAEVGDERGTGA